MKSRDQALHPSRRGFLTGAAAGLVSAATAPVGGAAAADEIRQQAGIEPFFGAHQAGIATAQQKHTYFAAFDLEAKTASQVIALMRAWTAAAAKLTSGEDSAAANDDLTLPGADSGESLGLDPARLTVTFGFGAGLFMKDGHDRYGLASARPAALVDLPKFNGDQLEPSRSGGDLSLQASADDPQIAFHAVRHLARLAYGAATLRWTQAGFVSRPAKGTPRNLMGFKDGTRQPQPLDAHVWVPADDPSWMRQGSYLVVRKIRIALEHWDRTPIDFQEQVVGRHKGSGAPLGSRGEFDPLNLDAADPDGNPIIPDNAHVRLAAAASNEGAQMLRRAYAYNDGTNVTAERWPPWRQGLEYDAGLLFIAYQRDPRTGFIKVFDKMSRLDAMNQFTTHVGGGLFACPGGVAQGVTQGVIEDEFIGQRLFGMT